MVYISKEHTHISLSSFAGFPWREYSESVSASETTIEFWEIEFPKKNSDEKKALVALSNSALTNFLKEEEKYEPLY